MPIEILMPALSPTMTEGNLAKWVKKEGDSVAPGDVIAEIETDKATMEVESVDEGKIGKIIIKEGTQNVAVNAVIALLLEEGEDQSAIDNYKPKEPEKQEDDEDEGDDSSSNDESSESKKSSKKKSSGGGSAEGLTPPPYFVPQSVSDGSSVKSNVAISPLAKRIAKEKAVNIESVSGTGPKGRIVKDDIINYIKNSGSGIVSRNPAEVTSFTNNNMRKIIASRLLQSKQHVPHFYLNVDCNLDKLLDARKDINDSAPIDSETGKPAYKLSVNDLIIKAAAQALKKHPEANASWTEDAIMLYNNVDISVAVATEGGLITPIVKNADQKSLQKISNEMKELAAKARKGTLQPEEFQGGGFSISNLGMYGIKNFNAIINPPQGCILAIGAGAQTPIVENGEIKIATIMTATLSCDHRVVDGAVGAEFLTAFKNFVQKPVTLF